GLSHAARQQRLAQRVVDLVRAGVEEILALEMNLSKPDRLAEARGMGDGRGPAREGRELEGEGFLEGWVPAHLVVGAGQLEHGGEEDLGNVGAAERPEPAARPGHDRLGRVRSASRIRSMKARTLRPSFLPGSSSSPLEASTPKGRTSRTSSTTLSGSSPPATMSLS